MHDTNNYSIIIHDERYQSTRPNLEGNFISQYGGVAMSDVGEGPRVYEDGCSLQRLQQVGADGVLQ